MKKYIHARLQKQSDQTITSDEIFLANIQDILGGYNILDYTHYTHGINESNLEINTLPKRFPPRAGAYIFLSSKRFSTHSNYEHPINCQL
jgi:hypothetical protein